MFNLFKKAKAEAEIAVIIVLVLVALMVLSVLPAMDVKNIGINNVTLAQALTVANNNGYLAYASGSLNPTSVVFVAGDGSLTTNNNFNFSGGTLNVSTVNATQLTATTGNFSQNLTAANLTVSSNATISYLNVSNITARDATVIVATANATQSQKAIANFVLSGTNDEVTLITAFNTLPLHSTLGGTLNNTRTGTFKVIGVGNINLGGLLDFPPMQDGNIIFPLVNMNGGGVRFDSMMNVDVTLPLLASSTNNTQVEFYPRTVSVDASLVNSPLFTANKILIYSLASNVTGIHFNTSANGTTGDISSNTFSISEIGSSVSPWFAVNSTSLFGKSNTIITPLPNTVILANTSNISVGNGSATALSWDTELADPASLHSGTSSQVVIKTPGFYQMVAQVHFSANNTGSRYVSVQMNGVNIGEVTANGTGTEQWITVTAYTFANIGNVIYVNIYQDTGGNLNVVRGTALGGQVDTYFSVQKINPN